MSIADTNKSTLEAEINETAFSGFLAFLERMFAFLFSGILE